MSIKVMRWLFASVLCMSACSDDKPVVIQPGTFSEDWPTALRGALVESKKCAVDKLNGEKTYRRKLTVKSGEMLNLSGWVFSEKDGAPSAVYVQLVGPALTYTALAQKRTDRTDVNLYFKLDPARHTGFELQAEQHAEPSEYQLEVLQPGEHSVIQCETKVYVKIDPAVTGA